METEHVEVSIFNRSYKLKSLPEQESYLKTLAKYVDDKMNQYSQKNPHFKPAKIAVLTALNIADELLRLKEIKPQIPVENSGAFIQKVESLINKLDQTLVS